MDNNSIFLKIYMMSKQKSIETTVLEEKAIQFIIKHNYYRSLYMAHLAFDYNFWY